MAREIRRVPPNWQHPKYEPGGMRTGYHPLRDCTYKEAITEWINNHLLWMEGKHPVQIENPETAKRYTFFAEYSNDAPIFSYHRPEWDQEPTWYQAYEAVSEGTPISPPFETKEELIDWLSSNEDFGGDTWTREWAEYFVNFANDQTP